MQSGSLLFVLCVFLTSANLARAQTSEMTLEQQASGSQELSVQVTCTGGVFTPLNDDYIDIWLGLFANGSLRAQEWQAGYGYVTAYAASSILIDRTDVPVSCELSSNWVSDSRSRVYPRRAPSVVESDSYSPFTYYGLGNYERVKYYSVTDNYGLRYGYAGAAVNENWTIDQQNNGCNITGVETSSATLNNEGRFQDTYGTQGSALPRLPGRAGLQHGA